ncbi:MAG: ABC transporter substrate-binding protein [Burkholderiales bacterium]|nr:ABC transporter substrate-binding protein [Burkholderiales bacterium]
MSNLSRHRRTALKGLAAAAALPLVGHSIGFAAGKPIVIGLPLVRSGPAGVADHQDHWNGAKMAVEEINAAGGVLGRPLELKVVDTDILTPEGTQAGLRKLAELKVQAISSPFVLIPQPAVEALGGYKAPYLHGNTSELSMEMVRKNPQKYWNVFQMDPPEIYYGLAFPTFLETLSASGAWKPINNKVHIIQEQIAYTQTISKATQQALKKSKFELAKVTDIQFPVQDWGPVVQDIKKTGAGVVMVDHWVAAEFASFCQTFLANPSKGALVYLQYGPSQPEFLQLAGKAAEGFIWSTVLGVYADAKGKEFRAKYKKKYPGVMGLAYTGMGYDSIYRLAEAWNKVGDPDKFKEVCDHLRKTPFRGVNGVSDNNNDGQTAVHYPIQTQDLNKGMAQLYLQVQNGEHRIIGPEALKESDFRKPSWM